MPARSAKVVGRVSSCGEFSDKSPYAPASCMFLSDDEDEDAPTLRIPIELKPCPADAAPPAPTIPAPFLLPSGLPFPRLSTDLIVIRDGFVRLPILACRSSAGDCCTRLRRSSGSAGEIVPRSLVIVESSSE